MPLGLGTAKGASFVNDWNKDIDRLYQREEYAANVRAQKEQKTRFYAEQLKKGHGSNPRTETELNDYYQGLNGQLADFVTENPNFETDVNAMQKFLDISDKYLNNDILRQDIQVKQEFDKLRDAVSKGEITENKYHEEMARYNDYIDPVKKGDPYVFTNFKKISSSDLLMDANKQLEPITTTALDAKTHMWNDIKTTPVDAIYRTAQAQYSDPDNKTVIDKEYAATIQNDPKARTQFPDATSYWTARIKAGEPVEKAFRAWDIEWQKNMEAGLKQNSRYAFFVTNELPKLNQLISATDDKGTKVNSGYAPASNNSIALTPFRQKGGSVNTSLSSGIKVETADGYDDFDENVQLKATGASRFKNIGGILYLETDVTFDTGFKPGEAFDELTPMIDQSKLDKWGFHSSESVTTPLLNNPSQTSVKRGVTNSGKVLVPLQIDENSMTEWDNQFLGAEHAKDIAPWYTENVTKVINSDPALLRHTIKQSTGKDIGVGITGLEPNDQLSQAYNGKWATAMYDGRRIAINLDTMERRELAK